MEHAGGPKRPSGPAVGIFMEDDKEERRGFQVRDRRRFSETGEAREEAEAETKEGPARSTPEAAAAAPSPDEDLHHRDAEPVTFSTFVLGLSTQALLHLGEIPDPVTNVLKRDLAAAKQVIDILGVLREKTRNNLQAGEETLLDSVLYDLRMRYVELARSSIKEAQ
jgi:hypothetical protein